MRINHNHHNPISRLNVPIIVGIMGLFLVVSVVYADNPIVCISGTGNVTLTGFDLTDCDAPGDQPVYVVLRVKSDDTTPATATLSEGSLDCQINAPLDGVIECAVTVRDGVLDTAQTGNAPENYQLLASWSPPTPGVYTSTLTSGDVYTIERTSTYGERYISGLLVFIALLQVVGLILFFVRGR
jgi:hypothetical protein